MTGATVGAGLGTAVGDTLRATAGFGQRQRSRLGGLLDLAARGDLGLLGSEAEARRAQLTAPLAAQREEARQRDLSFLSGTVGASPADVMRRSIAAQTLEERSAREVEAVIAAEDAQRAREQRDEIAELELARQQRRAEVSGAIFGGASTLLDTTVGLIGGELKTRAKAEEKGPAASEQETSEYNLLNKQMGF